MKRRLISTALALALAAGLALAPRALADDPIINVADSDPEMNAAIAKAQAGIAGFLAVLDAPPAGFSDVSFKYPLAGWEHIWVNDVARKGNTLTGMLANDPHEKGYELGERVEVPLAAVSDWGWRDGAGLMHGHFTTRVLLGRMPADQAAGVREFLGWSE